MIYDQNTEYEYETIDSSINVGTVVKYPYEDQYKRFLMKYLKSKDDLFESLTSVINVDRHKRERSVWIKWTTCCWNICQSLSLQWNMGQTLQLNAVGQYQFVGVEEGEYYVEFFRPDGSCESLLIGTMMFVIGFQDMVW